MLTKLLIRNFKKFAEVEIELGGTVVFIGPNNCGKTAALQALSLWNFGLQQWLAKRGEKTPKQRTGVALNRRDITAIPVPNLKFIWNGSHVRNVFMKNKKLDRTENINIDILVSGSTNNKTWECGLEFDFANPESCYCRQLRMSGNIRMEIPEEARSVNTAILPPMSGLADREYVKETGEINSLLGQGQTAQVLRNLCYQLSKVEFNGLWDKLVANLNEMFGITLQRPIYNAGNAEITMSYKEIDGTELDLSCSGRGLQQVLLLLTHLYSNPGYVLLLDEPDAHLEILRQEQIYELISNVAAQSNSQIIIASHSEVVLNAAADRDVVVAFVGKPHRIDNRGSQILKSLKEIGYDQYYQAEQKGWILYLEGSTDLAILRTFAEILDHPARKELAQPFAHYVLNQPQKAEDHFFGLREAKEDLVGIAIFDRIDRTLKENPPLKKLQWKRRELENYLCTREVLIDYARANQPDDLFLKPRINAMENSIQEITRSLKSLDKPDPWSPDIKVTDEFLDPLFKMFFEKLKLPNELRKSNYHVLAKFVLKDQIDPEVIEKLDAIMEVAKKAKPRTD